MSVTVSEQVDVAAATVGSDHNACSLVGVVVSVTVSEQVVVEAATVASDHKVPSVSLVLVGDDHKVASVSHVPVGGDHTVPSVSLVLVTDCPNKVSHVTARGLEIPTISHDRDGGDHEVATVSHILSKPHHGLRVSLINATIALRESLYTTRAIRGGRSSYVY